MSYPSPFHFLGGPAHSHFIRTSHAGAKSENPLLQILVNAEYHKKTRRVQFAFDFMYDQVKRGAPGSRLYFFSVAGTETRRFTSADDEMKDAIATFSADMEHKMEWFLMHLANLFVLPPEWLLANAKGELDPKWLGTTSKTFLTKEGRARMVKLEKMAFVDKDYTKLAASSVLTAVQWRAIVTASEKLGPKRKKMDALKAKHAETTLLRSEYQSSLGKLDDKLKKSRKAIRCAITGTSKKDLKKQEKLKKRSERVASAIKIATDSLKKVSREVIGLERDMVAGGNIGVCIPGDPRDIPLFITSIMYWDGSYSNDSYPTCLRRLNNRRQSGVLSKLHRMANTKAGVPARYATALKCLCDTVRLGQTRVNYDYVFEFDGGFSQLFLPSPDGNAASALDVFAPFTLRILVQAYDERHAYLKTLETPPKKMSEKAHKSAKRSRGSKHVSKMDPAIAAALADSSSSEDSGSSSESGDPSSSSSAKLMSSSENEIAKEDSNDKDSDESIASLHDESENASLPAVVEKSEELSQPLETPMSPAPEESSSSSSSDSDSDYPLVSNFPLRVPSESYAASLGDATAKRTLDNAKDGDAASSESPKHTTKRARADVTSALPAVSELGMDNWVLAKSDQSPKETHISDTMTTTRAAGSTIVDKMADGAIRPRNYSDDCELVKGDVTALSLASNNVSNEKSIQDLLSAIDTDSALGTATPAKEVSVSPKKKKRGRSAQSSQSSVTKPKKKRALMPMPDDIPVVFESADEENDEGDDYVYRASDSSKTLDEFFEDMLEFCGEEDPMTLVKGDKTGAVAAAIEDTRVSVRDPEFTRRYFDPYPDLVMSPTTSDLREAFDAITQRPGHVSTISPSVLVEAGYLALHSNRVPGSLARSIIDGAAASEKHHESAILEAFKSPVMLQRIGQAFEQVNSSCDVLEAFYGKEYSRHWLCPSATH